MRIIKYLILVLVFISQSTFTEAPQDQEILHYSQTELPHMGILMNSGGFVYVNVDDEYIHHLVKFIEKEGFEEPPYFGKDLVGAHITVMYPREIKEYGIEEIYETGTPISFQLKECQIVHPPNWKEIDKVYFITVEAPELDRIREKYRLPKREYDFHITIGVQRNQDNHFSETK